MYSFKVLPAMIAHLLNSKPNATIVLVGTKRKITTDFIFFFKIF